MLCVMCISLANFLAGSIMGPESDLEKAKGFIGYSSNTSSRSFIKLK